MNLSFDSDNHKLRGALFLATFNLPMIRSLLKRSANTTGWYDSRLSARLSSSASCRARVWGIGSRAFSVTRIHDSALKRGSRGQIAGILPSYHQTVRPCASLASISDMSSAAIARDKPRDEYRLPLNVKPTHYDVTIRTDLEKLTFDGFVNIEYVRFHLLL